MENAKAILMALFPTTLLVDTKVRSALVNSLELTKCLPCNLLCCIRPRRRKAVRQLTAAAVKEAGEVGLSATG